MFTHARMGEGGSAAAPRYLPAATRTDRSPALAARAAHDGGSVGTLSSARPVGAGFISVEGPAEPGDRLQIGIGRAGARTDAGASAASRSDAGVRAAPPGAGTPDADAGRPVGPGVSAPETTRAGGTATTACAITNTATVHAPDGTPDSRTTIGACETIRFTLGGAVADWRATAGWPGGGRARATFDWAAPETSGTQTITATTPGGGTCSIDMSVVAPRDITVKKTGPVAYAAGSAGAGMTLEMRLQPRNVNFGWLAIREDPRPATGVTGYFSTRAAAGADLSHHPNPDFERVGWNNIVCCDTAATVAGSLTPPPAWADGTFNWVVPTRFRYFDDEWSDGRVFTTTVQRFAIDAAGRVTVGKFGERESRSP